MNVRKHLAVKNYKRFCHLEGSDYIASQFALETILKLIKKFRLKKVLELGLGIGSISDTVLKYDKDFKISYYGTEGNAFCLSILPQNVDCFKRIKLFSELDEIEEHDFDFIIIDGSDNSLKNIKKYCAKDAVIFIEGGRDSQRQIILDIFPNSLHVDIISLEKNPPYAHEDRSIESYIGGGKLIFTNPTFEMKSYWFKEKCSTFFKRKLRMINE